MQRTTPDRGRRPRRDVPLLLALGIGAGLAYLALAPHLPDTSGGAVPVPEAERGSVAAGAARAPAPAPATSGDEAESAEAEAEAEHDDSGDACGLDAKAMLARFREAVAEKGAIHPTYAYSEGSAASAQAVSGRVNVGLEPEAFAAGALASLAQRHGLRVRRALPRMGQALLLRPDADAEELAGVVAALEDERLVRYAEADFAAQVALTPNDPFLRLMDGRRDADVERAWDVTTGDRNVLVAVLDTGVDMNHPDLMNRLVRGFDFVNQTANVRDDNGHGTAMAGIVAAEGDNAEGVVGVAMDARVLPVKVADASGTASVADVVAGIDYAIQRNARVVNLSMGTPVGTQALQDAVDRALAAGLVVVASAGNDPVHHEAYPAAYPGVVSATSLGPNGDLGFESVVAEGVEVGAPGEDLPTTLPGNVYGFVSGTSAAAAYASGVAALCASRDPTLTGEQVAQCLAHGQDPVSALAGLETTYRFGRLNARRAVDRASAGYLDVAVTDLRISPQKPQPGQQATAAIEVTNEGNVATTNLPVRLQRQLASGQVIEIDVRTVTLAPGERSEVRIAFTAPTSAGTHPFIGLASARPGETETQDNDRTLQLTVNANADADVRLVGRRITDPDLAAGTVTVFATVENRGTAAAQNVTLDARVTAVVPRTGPTPTTPPQPTALGQRVVPSLAVGERATVSWVYPIPSPAPRGILRFEGTAQPLPGETATADNSVFLDFRLGGSGPLRGLYQQSNGVDVIPDAPWRVDPQRPWVPVLLFVPSKGGRTPSTRLRVTRTTIHARDVPAGRGGTPVYEDTHGSAPATAPSGLEIVDELGQARSGPQAQDAFGDTELDMNGHHDILRVPRAALGLGSSPPQPVTKYLDVDVEWEHRRLLFFGWSTSRSGSHRSVLRVKFSSDGLPELPGDNHYHDVHHHTIAEWYFGSPLDIFAPRKAYGGPLQMVFDSAYAMGVIDQPSASGAHGRIITTDHNAFNNRTTPDPDGPDHRPPFGPQAPSQHPSGTTQLEAYRAVLGPTAGEEIAVKQDVPIPKIHPVVNKVLDVLPGLPLGAHMLLYGGDHVEGPWHGGGWLKGPGNPNIDVDLFPLLNDLAKNRQQRQGDAFAYCAHPFGGMGWRDTNLERGFGLQSQHRAKDALHDGSEEFVLKGIEFFNGRGTRSLPTGQIDFDDLNPWADPTFARGVQRWDQGIWDGMTRWHEMMAKTLEYSFTSDPDTRFIRKIYQAGGSDAHGDFNFNTSRAATPLNVQATYNVGDEAWYGVRTYCFGDDKAGATPEERWLEAYADGNSVTTDGPVCTFGVDADGRFDAADLQWHDATSAAEDTDGRIGGGGPLDGGRTALVERGSAAPVFRYRYSSSPEFGPVASVHLYKTSAGDPNPTRTRQKGGLLGGTYEQIVGVNDMALGGADTWLEQPLDPNEEGTVDDVTAFALGAYTGGDPDQQDLGPDEYRCYTNPVFCVPYDAKVDVAAVDSARGTIPAGGLEVQWTFDVSMEPGSYAIEVKGLDGNGESTPAADPALTTLVPQSGSGWADRPDVASSELTLVNQDPIPLGGPAYPAAGRVSFVIYWRDAPRDAAGNELNRIATTFETALNPNGRSSTAAPATAGGGGGGGGGGSGCALKPAPTTSAPTPGALLALLLAGLVAARRVRCRR